MLAVQPKRSYTDDGPGSQQREMHRCASLFEFWRIRRFEDAMADLRTQDGSPVCAYDLGNGVDGHVGAGGGPAAPVSGVQDGGLPAVLLAGVPGLDEADHGQQGQDQRGNPHCDRGVLSAAAAGGGADEPGDLGQV
ncbi:hypothetical protein [Actinomadura sp. WMMA1423]|uniref:hypothetical protein n=1 Tax=Actinomadura sp. WMMA1423 TaxID=2591108 RepID=UPI0011474306|nr:hypothetical protein [Actinomadura sp. WMMA1423]